MKRAGLALLIALLAVPAAGLERPQAIPYPATNPYSPEKLELGKALFFDTRLSGGNDLSCASCHDPALGFADGMAVRPGLSRHTPSLWNLAWGSAFFWDGRAPTLEAQAQGPITNPKEMNLALPELEKRLKADGAMRLAFAQAFPENPRVSAENVTAALATFVRSLVSPLNRVDAGKLTAAEKRGEAIFNGKAGCVSCHSGFAFTDNAFHDIGLGGDDEGRGPVIGMPVLSHAFKTPSLRGISHSAPYMHNGAFADLEAVVFHYESATAPGLAHFSLSDAERADLIAYLKAVGEGESEPQVLPASADAEVLPPAVATADVSQKGRAFAPHHIEVAAGQTIIIRNDDDVDHTVRLRDGGEDFSSNIEAPGSEVQLALSKPGTYRAFCGIHPNMELIITVKEAQP